jgi:hypothetical protein
MPVFCPTTQAPRTSTDGQRKRHTVSSASANEAENTPVLATVCIAAEVLDFKKAEAST